MNIFTILGIFIVFGLGYFSFNSVYAQIDPLSEIEFFQTGELGTLENQFQISSELNIREFFNGNIIRVSGVTVEGFPYITYSMISEEQISTRGVIFIQGEFEKLDFSKKVINETIIPEKDENISLLVKYTQRAYSEKYVYVDVKVYDKDQNQLNDFNLNYGFLQDVEINIKFTDEDGQIVFSSNGTTNQNGLFESKYLIPENSKRETLLLSINAENDSSSTSKIFQVFSLGQIPDNDSN